EYCPAGGALVRLTPAGRRGDAGVTAGGKAASRQAPRGAALRAQRTVHVCEQVAGRFAAGAEADEPFGHGVSAPASTAFGGRVHAAEARRLANEAQGSEESFGRRAIRELEADDGAEGIHLPRRDVVAWMIGESRI